MSNFVNTEWHELKVQGIEAERDLACAEATRLADENDELRAECTRLYGEHNELEPIEA